MNTLGVPPALEDAVDSLIDAVKAGRTDIFRKLLDTCETCEGGGIEERKQLVNSLCTEDGTFLHMATKLGHCDIIRALLLSGADPAVLDKLGNTPVQLSQATSSAVYVEELLRATAKSEIGRVCQLIASGVDVNSPDNSLSRNTALHWAASFADVDTVNCLISRGARVNGTNGEGKTPLHDAVLRGNDDVVAVLMNHGANPHIQSFKGTYKGKTPFDLSEAIPSIRGLIEASSSNLSAKDLQPPFAANGSISPALQPTVVRRGSIESLVSVGADSVLSNNMEVNGSRGNIARSESLVSLSRGRNGVLPNVNGHIKHNRRPPLESTSSLDMTPIIEQVCQRLSTVQMTSMPRPLVVNPALHKLWPQPKRIREISGPAWKVPPVLSLAITSHSDIFHSVVDVWTVHKPWFERFGREIQLDGFSGPRNCIKDEVTLQCVVDSCLAVSKDHYSLVIHSKGAKLMCGSLSALHHCLSTLAQILRVFSPNQGDAKPTSEQSEPDLSVPQLFIVDFPSVPDRGFMLDMSPISRIPVVEKIYQIVDTLASLKMNQLHLLFKITSFMPYQDSSPESNAKYSRKCSPLIPFSSNELLALERYCSDRFVELIPGVDLVPTECHVFPPEDVISSVADVISNIPRAKYLHFGPTLTSYVRDLCSQSQSSMWSKFRIPDSTILMLCANVFRHNPIALQSIPVSCILVEYGFQADYDFSLGCQMATENGRSLAVCPGTAAWSSLSGWPEAGVSNVYSGVVCGVENAARGVLVANWSNPASFTPLSFAWPPLVVAAGLSWNHTTHWDFVHSSVGSLIDVHLFEVPDCGVGDALIELGRCETWLTRIARDQAGTDSSELPSGTGSTLHQFLVDPDSVNVEHLNVEVFANLMRHVRKVVKDAMKRNNEFADMPRRSPWPLTALTVRELQLAMDMILAASRIGRALVTSGVNPRASPGLAVINPGVANLPPTMRTDLANKILELREVNSSVWVEGYHSSGLQASLLTFNSLLSRLLPEQHIHGI